MRYAALLSLLLGSAASAAEPTNVPIYFFEALAPKDTTSSERFQKEYEAAIRTAKLLAAPKLASCGYQIEDHTVFYEASDALQAHEGGQASEKAKAWLIVGPRRSNHYTLLAKGAPNSPSVSTMASSREVEELGSLHRSIAPGNQQMADAAASEVKRLNPSTRKLSYISIVSEDCLSCVDFSSRFDESAKRLKIHKLGEHRIKGESPVLEPIAAAVAVAKPSFVLVPNFSKVAAQVIAAIHKVDPSVTFVGGDGWGDSRFGFLQDAKDLDGTKGITIRGFPSTETGLMAFPLGRGLLSSKDPLVTRPGSAAALAILKILDGTVDLLCKRRPKTGSEFKAAFLKGGAGYFKSPWGVSVYKLKDGDISFEKIVRSNPQ